MAVNVVYCFAIGPPEPRAECTIGGVDLVASSPQALAQGLLEMGAPDDLVMVFRLRGVMHPDDYSETGYSSGELGAFAAGRDVYVEIEPYWTQRFSWMKNFGI